MAVWVVVSLGDASFLYIDHIGSLYLDNLSAVIVLKVSLSDQSRALTVGLSGQFALIAVKQFYNSLLDSNGMSCRESQEVV